MRWRFPKHSRVSKSQASWILSCTGAAFATKTYPKDVFVRSCSLGLCRDIWRPCQHLSQPLPQVPAPGPARRVPGPGRAGPGTRATGSGPEAPGARTRRAGCRGRARARRAPSARLAHAWQARALARSGARARRACKLPQQHPLHSKHHPDTSRARDLGPTSPNIPGPRHGLPMPRCPTFKNTVNTVKATSRASSQAPSACPKCWHQRPRAGLDTRRRVQNRVCVCVLFLLWLARAVRDSSANCSARNNAMCLSHACTPMRSTCLRTCSHPRAPCAFHVGRRVYVCVLM